MNTIVRLVLVSLLIIVATPAYSAEATHMWRCELSDDATEQDVEDMAAAWLKGAKELKGGANLTAAVYFPVAVNNTGQTDLIFLVTAPSFSEWGQFWDVYGEGKAVKAERDYADKIVCPDSALWESVPVK